MEMRFLASLRRGVQMRTGPIDLSLEHFGIRYADTRRSRVNTPSIGSGKSHSSVTPLFRRLLSFDMEMNTDDLQCVVREGLMAVLGIDEYVMSSSVGFTALGGDSLAAIRLISYCRNRGILISMQDILQSREIRSLGKYATLDPLQQTKSVAVLDHSDVDNLQDDASSTKSNLVTTNSTTSIPIGSLNIDGEDTLTEMQAAFLNESATYGGVNIIYLATTYASRDLSKIRSAWKHVLSLESIFQGSSLNMTKERLDHEWTEITTSSDEEYKKEIESTQQLSPGISCFRVVTRTDSDLSSSISTVIWCVHHAFIDGYSARLLHAKVLEFANGEEVQPGTPFSQVVRDLKDFQNRHQSSAKAFWGSQQSRFGSAVSELNLLPENKREQPSTVQSTIAISTPYGKICRQAKVFAITPATIYCAAWGLVISKLMNSDEVVFGLVCSGRDLPINGMQDTIGPAINTLPFFVSASSAATTKISSYLQHVFCGLNDLFAVQFSRPQDGFKREFSSIMAFQYDMDIKTRGSEFPIRPVRSVDFIMRSSFPLSILVGSTGEVRFCFNDSSFSVGQMKLISDCFTSAVKNLVSSQNAAIIDCLAHMLSSQTRKTLMCLSNCNTLSTFDGSIKEDLVTKFEQIVRLQGEDLGILMGEEQMSYNAIDHAANRIANRLQWLCPEDSVCVIADRSLNWIPSIFGILKAGGVYVPLDPTVPAKVRNENIRRCQARAVLVPSGSGLMYDFPQDVKVLIVQKVLDEQNYGMAPNIRECARPDDCAYICFTSGSTGSPKAVQCTHKGLVAFHSDERVRLFASPGILIAQTMSPIFDGSIAEIFSALCHGATLVLPDPNTIHPFEHIRRCDSAILTPSLAKVLSPMDYPKLKNVYLVGEAVPQHVCDTWAKHKVVYNMYGPTETTCGATIKRLIPGKSVSIGRPNPSSRVYILDRNKQLMPPSTIGELYIAGIQVSRGYLGNTESSTSKFLQDSIMPLLNERMYQTGDLGFWDSDTQEIHLLGRIDRQIKLRGYKLDLGSLEARIATAIPEAEDVVVHRRGDQLGVALRPATIDVQTLRARILGTLPPYAIPSRILVVNSFPVTQAGKLDYNRLEQEDGVRYSSPSSIRDSKVEMVVSQGWRHVLSLSPDTTVTDDMNFLELGGHSVLQIRLSALLSKHLGRSIPMKIIIQNPSFRDLVEMLSKEETFDIESAKIKVNHGMDVLGHDQVSPIEEDWFWKYQTGQKTSTFNVSCAYQIHPEAVDRQALIEAWNIVLAKYAILRSRYKFRDGVVRRELGVEPPRCKNVETICIRDFINAEFDLSNDDLVRIAVSPRHMVVSISHILCDLTTLRQLFEDVISCYKEGFSHKPVLREYHQTAWCQSLSDKEILFWKEYLSDLGKIQKHVPQLAQPTFSGESYTHKFPSSSRQSVEDLTSRFNMTFHQFGLALTGLSLNPNHLYFSDMILGGPFLGRGPDDHDTIGLFLQALPIRIKRTAEHTSLKEFMSGVRETSQSALAHAAPWNLILKQFDPLHGGKTQKQDNVLDVMVTFHHGENSNLGMVDMPGFEELHVWSDGAKFGILIEFSFKEGCLVTRVEYRGDILTKCGARELCGRIERALSSLSIAQTDGEVTSDMKQNLGILGAEIRFGHKWLYEASHNASDGSGPGT